LDLHAIDLPSQSAGTVLCLDTLEHVEYPRRALEEIHRILRPDGIAVVSSVMDCRIHDYPYDYWRFTPEAFRSILKPFASSWVGFAGAQDFPHTVVGIGFKGEQPALGELERTYEKWCTAWGDGEGARGEIPMHAWLRLLLTPPLLSRRARKLLGLRKRSR
ncbi:MAG: class I SAM-dependent methyltransferase, partial [Deltaproteobacteria bacterium]|nr:class I SAM-dependent methyltransferase [Deltaproteobacteria bacterium]